ncbi:hippurate hydrolase [Syntrophus gentianae]|uniref:Hippurate hydrolase n=1 Tax=Syntrophus gentianae TaxID=43775 RepID=A0A1H7V6A3_9BACT|nr:amidohydrolase [Syntrophus gentianae]SEM04736.1 hippurate hydrolase [Syntrophus gentianae]
MRSGKRPDFEKSDLLKTILACQEEEYPFLESLYQDLHRFPELSGKEEETSRRMAAEMEEAGFRTTSHIGGYGVVGVLENGSGPAVMVRADLDALPVGEKTGLPYASRVRTLTEAGSEVGVMHACGHDIHMTVLAGTARLLGRFRHAWQGSLILVAQPAEENASGAAAMIADGLFSRFPRPDFALGLHVLPEPAGTLFFHEGYWFAGSSTVELTVYGKGGHAARPHEAIDPIVLSAQMILAFQTLVSRETDPTETVVLTVSSIHAGARDNIIPEKAFFQISIRALSREQHDRMIRSLKRTADGIAWAAGLPEDRFPRLSVRGYTPALYNDPNLTRRIVRRFHRTFGRSRVLEMPVLTVSEDFAHFGLTEPRIPLCFFGLGMADPQGSMPSLHSPYLAPIPKPTIQTGIAAMTAAVLELISLPEQAG